MDRNKIRGKKATTKPQEETMYMEIVGEVSYSFKEFKKKKCVGPVPYSIKWKSYENTFSGKRIRKKVTIVACDHKEKPVHIVVRQHLDLGKLIQ